MSALDEDTELDALDARFDAALARMRDVPRDLGPDELVTLCLPPFWPESLLAQQLGGAAKVQELLVKAGPLVHAQGKPGDRAITLADPESRAVKRAIATASNLPDRAASVAAQLRSRGELPPLLAQWADLASLLATSSPAQIGRGLVEEVAQACAAKLPGAVQDRVEAAISLGGRFGPPFSGWARVAQHRLNRWYRTERDRRKLEYFVPRESALAAFHELLQKPDTHWALHYVGVGGTGKTSLIRHLSTRVAESAGLQVARIDFDNLSPEFPARDPGQLISELLQDLTAMIETEGQDKTVGQIGDALRNIAAVRLDEQSTNVDEIFERRDVTSLIDEFGELLKSFPRPTFILDTCEELSKVEMAGHEMPSVKATFMLLERLHAKAPQLRVVLAGRRLLATDYQNRAFDMSVLPVGAPRIVRDYMRFHELRGFDEPEARRYLELRLPPTRKTDDALVGRLLELSPEPMRIQLLAEPAAARSPAKPDHYNPFDLNRYADWVDAVPDVELAAFNSSEGDPYVEVRIIRRMGALDTVLPAIALMRRFDISMLALAVPGSKSDAERLFDELTGHEWLKVSTVGGRRWLEVDRGLPARIEASLRTTNASGLARVRGDLGAALRARISGAETELGSVPSEVIDAALRILPPDEAIALWQWIESRLGGPGWSWASELANDLIATDAAGDDETSLLGAMIRATLASALIHIGNISAVVEQWKKVETTALTVVASHESKARRSVASSPAWLLLRRARLGRIAFEARMDPEAGVGSLVLRISEIAGELVRWGLAREVESSLCAAIEAVVDLAERTPAVQAQALETLTEHLWFKSAPALAAFGQIVIARIDSLAEEQGLLESTPGVTFDIREPTPDLPTTLLDWRPPESLRDRIRLEAVRFASDIDEDDRPPWLEPLTTDLAEVWASEADPDTTDGDRLLSALLLHVAIPQRKPFRQRHQAQTSGPPIAWTGEERCAAHRFVPPLAYTQGRLALWRGELDDARERAAELPQPWSVRLTCEIARWTRLPSDLDPLGVAAQLDERTGREVALARAIVEGAEPRGKVDPLATWDCQAARSREDAARLVESVRDRIETIAAMATANTLFGSLAAVHASLVLREIVLLSQFTENPVLPHDRPAPPSPKTVHPDVREECRRLALRAQALDPDHLRAPLATTEQANVKWILFAIEEAEVLDLRLPDVALWLFGWAERAARGPAHIFLRKRAIIGALFAARHADDRAAFDKYLQIWRNEVAADPLLQPREDVPAAYARATGPIASAYQRGRVLKPTLLARGREWLRKQGKWGVLLFVLFLAACGGIIVVLDWLKGRIEDELHLGQLSGPAAWLVVLVGMYAAYYAIRGLWWVVELIGDLFRPSGGERRLQIDQRALVTITRIGATKAELVLEAEPTIAGTIRDEMALSLFDLREDLPLGTLEMLGATFARLAERGGRTEVALDADHELVGYPWEYLIWATAIGLGTKDVNLLERLDICRLVRKTDRQLPQTTFGPHVLASGARASKLRNEWVGEIGVVHIVMRLRRSRRQAIEAVTEYGQLEDELPDLDSELMRAARLVVVQCEPIADAESSTEEIRLARELMVRLLRPNNAHGIVIPAVPLSQFDKVVTTLADSYRSGGAIAAVRALREQVSGPASSGVTYFIRERTPLPEHKVPKLLSADERIGMQ